MHTLRCYKTYQKFSTRDGIVDGTEETGALFVDLCTPDGTVDVDPLTDTTGEESPRPLQV